MYKFMNNPYLHGPYMEADKGGGAGGSGADDGADDAGGDDQDDDESDEDGDDQDEKKFSQKDIDEAIKKRLSREKRKWQREQQKGGSAGGSNKEDKPQDDAGDSEADKKARAAEEKAAALEMKWTCLEHDVNKDCVDDVLALAKVHMAKDEDLDIEDAIDKVLKKYPQFKDGYEEADVDDGQEKKGWGQRHGKPQKKATTVEDEIRKQLFGK